MLRNANSRAAIHQVHLVRALPYVVIVLGIFTVLTLSFDVYFRQTTIGSDLSTYLLPAVAREEGLGLLYVDLLDIKPPLIFALFVPWVAVIGGSLTSMWVLYAVVLLLMFVAFALALLQQLPPWVAAAVFAAALISIVYFSMLEEFFFTTEAAGSTMVLWALVMVRWRPQGLLWLFAASLLLGAAGQVKEVFLFVPLSLVPIAWAHRHRMKAIAVMLGGVVSAYVLTALVLIWWGDGVLTSYLEVLRLKQGRFPLPTGTEVLSLVSSHGSQLLQWLPLFPIVIALIIILLFWRRDRKGSNSANGGHGVRQRGVALSPSEWMLITYLIATYVGFLWQGSPLLKYFALTLVFPVYLVISVLIRHVMLRFEGGSRRGTVLLGVALLIGIAPSLGAVSWAAGATASAASRPIGDRIGTVESDQDLAIYERIREIMPPGGCLHVAYGWPATAHYLYAGVPPCTRFTLPPLVSQIPALWEPFVEGLLERPPSILVYEPDRASTDAEIVSFASVVSRCYQQDPVDSRIFIARGGSLETRRCMEDLLLQTSPVFSNGGA
jgi:hypothetical protein